MFMPEVEKKGGLPCFMIDLITDMAVKVAIGTFGDTERPVDIESNLFTVRLLC